MTEQEFQAILAGEREADLSDEESRALEEFLETERGRELLAEAERELEPLAAGFDSAPPTSWARVDEAIQAELESGGKAVLTPPELPTSRNWGGTLLLAAGLLFAAALGLAVIGPGKKKDGSGMEATIRHPSATPKAGSMRPDPLTATPEETLPLAGDPAVALEVKPGKDYLAQQETRDGSLLIVTVRAKSADEEH